MGAHGCPVFNVLDSLQVGILLIGGVEKKTEDIQAEKML